MLNNNKSRNIDKILISNKDEEDKISQVKEPIKLPILSQVLRNSKQVNSINNKDEEIPEVKERIKLPILSQVLSNTKLTKSQDNKNIDIDKVKVDHSSKNVDETSLVNPPKLSILQKAIKINLEKKKQQQENKNKDEATLEEKMHKYKKNDEAIIFKSSDSSSSVKSSKNQNTKIKNENRNKLLVENIDKVVRISNPEINKLNANNISTKINYRKITPKSQTVKMSTSYLAFLNKSKKDVLFNSHNKNKYSNKINLIEEKKSHQNLKVDYEPENNTTQIITRNINNDKEHNAESYKNKAKLRELDKNKQISVNISAFANHNLISEFIDNKVGSKSVSKIIENNSQNNNNSNSKAVKKKNINIKRSNFFCCF